MISQSVAFIIEDNARLGDVFSRALEMFHITTELILDGRLALARLNEVEPDLIVLDLHLPYVSGDVILRAIRADKRLAHIPVILATADSRLADYMREQAEIVLLKPISPKELGVLAARLLAKTEGSDNSITL